MSTTAVKNALPTAVLVFGTQKVVAGSMGASPSMEVQMEAPLVSAVGTVVVDSSLRGQNSMVRSVAVGGLLAGGMYLWKGDENWAVWVPVGAISYYLSDWATTSMRM